jgi:hypothetical protein
LEGLAAAIHGWALAEFRLPVRDLAVTFDKAANSYVVDLPELHLRRAAGSIVDLVFTDDMELFDSLPDSIQANLGPPLSMLHDPLDDAAKWAELMFAATLVEEIAAGCGRALPPELVDRIDAMAAARRRLVP